MQDILHDLSRLGFSEKESAVYLALLSDGKITVPKIAEKAKINRATAYYVLDSLVKKGLVFAMVEKGEKLYAAEPPERLIRLLSSQMQELEEQRRLADGLLLRLQVFYNTGGLKPKISYIESISGLRMLQREYEEMNEDLIQIIGYDAFLALQDPVISKTHQKELNRRARHVRSIIITDRAVSFPDCPGIEYVVIPKGVIDIDGEMTVCGDRLVLFSYASGIIAVEIKSKTIAHTARATLELAWKEAKRYSG
ncbi:MAG: helix-turn-helix domain-containing protein [Patescibacteria group bacterium]|jgi:sugar-specific transcriptional regulator TrmB